MKLSIYDLDYTLCKRDTFKLFYTYLLRKELISPKFLWLIRLNYLLFVLKLKGLTRIRESVLFALRGRDKDEIDNIAVEFLTELKQEYFRAELLTTIDLEKNNGYFLILLTASPDIYADKIGERLGFDKIIAATTEFNEGRFTGLTLGQDLKREQKLRALKREMNLNAYDLNLSRGYGNKDDMPWLNLLGHVKVYK